ncbi:MAG: TIGR00266 family protein [Planctomycetota bacterium]
MNIEILGGGGFGSARIDLQAGETFVSESGAMYRASSNVDVDVTTKSRGKGGLLAGVKRLFAKESFFFSTYRAEGGPGEVAIAPTHQGEVRRIAMDGTSTWSCAGGSYLGSSTDIDLETRFQGLKGVFSGESLSFLEASGTGDLLVGAFGRIVEIDVERDAGGALTIDTGHLVAFETSLQYRLAKATGSILQSFLTGEGFVLHMQGRGRVLVQSHNPTELGKTLGPMLPPRQ